MDNEATKSFNQSTPPTPPQPEMEEKKSSGNASRAAFAAAGVAAGVGAAMAGQKAYEAFVEGDEEANQAPQQEQAQAAPKAAPAEAAPKVAPAEETPKAEATQPEEVHQVEEVHQHKSAVQQQEVADDDVRVVGVGITENGQGGVATIIGVQNDEDSALLVDFETDGRVDALVHDDNQDGQIEGNEIHDVSGDNLSTEQMVASDVEDAQNNGEVATVVNLSTGERFALNSNPGDDNIYPSQSGDGADDYQPVADPEPVPEDVDPGFTDCSDATVDFVESDSATFDA